MTTPRRLRRPQPKPAPNLLILKYDTWVTADDAATIKRRVRQETGWPCLVVGKSVSDVVAVTQ